MHGAAGAKFRGRVSTRIAVITAIAALLASSPSLAQTPAVTQAPEYVPGEIIVKVKGRGRTMRAQAFVGKAVAEKGMSLKGTWSGMNMHHFALKGRTVEAALAEMRNDPDVEYAEPNYIVKRQSTGLEGPVMTYEQMQVAVAQRAAAFGGPELADAVSASAASGGVSVSSATTYTQSYAPIQVPQAWAQMTTGKTPPVVAVIDTGLDLNSTVFVNSGAIWTNPGEIAGNGLDDDGNGFVDDVKGWNFAYNNNNPQDDNGHGTHVSGIVLGISMDIRRNPIGTAPVRIMPLKFLDSAGSGTTADAVNAIYYAVNNGARILNNSWGGGGFSASLLDAINYSYNAHCLFVAAAGNAANNNDAAPTYPASYTVPNIMAVAATSDWDSLASFSNYGRLSVNLGGPGVSVLSTFPNNTWAYESGTSMATPMVAGIAALMLRERPGMYGWQMKNLIFGANNSVSALAGKTTTQGRVNANASIVAAKAAALSTVQPSYDAAAYARSLASVETTTTTTTGCGTVSERVLDREGGEDFGGSATALLVAVLLAPVAFGLALRARHTGRDARRHDRFQISSQVRMKVGDRELTGSISSISLGGAQVNADALLEAGGLVSMRIAAPDGSGEVEVQGKVVWSEENKRYGVAFSKAEAGTLAAIRRWTAGLAPER